MIRNHQSSIRNEMCPVISWTYGETFMDCFPILTYISTGSPGAYSTFQRNPNVFVQSLSV